MARRFVSISNTPLRAAVVGYGYWGPNLVRNVMERAELEFAGLCERAPDRAAAFTARYGAQTIYEDLAEVLADETIEALVVATPPRTHYAIVRAALEAGKHVLVEKPLATTSSDAADLIDVAARHGRTLMPGHTFVYSPPVNKVKELIDNDVLGEVYFVTSSRMNLGKYQADGVVLDLAPHDLSILLYWLGVPVVEVAATGRSIFQDGVHETAFITLTFASRARANIQVSWLAPRKVREMTVVGSHRMVQYDDTAVDEAIRVFDRGMEFSTPETFGEYQLTYRSGDMIVPRIEPAEPLGLELADFARAVRTGTEPRSNAQLGLEIVCAMEAAEESIRRNGEPISVAVPVARAAA